MQIVGREHELDSLSAAVGGAADGFRTLVLEGEPGIGKSRLWAATVEAARDRSLSVLAARPAEAEQRLPHVVLGDLLADVDRSVFAALVPPRRRALERALLLGDAAGDDMRAQWGGGRAARVPRAGPRSCSCRWAQAPRPEGTAPLRSRCCTRGERRR